MADRGFGRHWRSLTPNWTITLLPGPKKSFPPRGGMLVQGASGVAKDLSKMSSENPGGQAAGTIRKITGFLRWVAALTGSKNAVKGLGFFLGAALLALAGFHDRDLGHGYGFWRSSWSRIILLLPAGPAGADEIRRGLVRLALIPKTPRVKQAIAGTHVPVRRARRVVRRRRTRSIFRRCSRTANGGRTARGVLPLVGGFMALWIIGYGAGAGPSRPRLLGPGAHSGAIPKWQSPQRRSSGLGYWCPSPLRWRLWCGWRAAPAPWLTTTLVAGAFAVRFCLCR